MKLNNTSTDIMQEERRELPSFALRPRLTRYPFPVKLDVILPNSDQPEPTDPFQDTDLPDFLLLPQLQDTTPPRPPLSMIAKTLPLDVLPTLKRKRNPSSFLNENLEQDILSVILDKAVSCADDTKLTTSGFQTPPKRGRTTEITSPPRIHRVSPCIFEEVSTQLPLLPTFM